MKTEKEKIENIIEEMKKRGKENPSIETSMDLGYWRGFHQGRSTTVTVDDLYEAFKNTMKGSK